MSTTPHDTQRPRDARTVRVVESCPRCLGTGRRWDLTLVPSSSPPCPACKGTGSNIVRRTLADPDAEALMEDGRRWRNGGDADLRTVLASHELLDGCAEWSPPLQAKWDGNQLVFRRFEPHRDGRDR